MPTALQENSSMGKEKRPGASRVPPAYDDSTNVQLTGALRQGKTAPTGTLERIALMLNIALRICLDLLINIEPGALYTNLGACQV